MRVSETIIDGDPAKYEQRYTTYFATLPLRFVRRSIAIEPAVGTVCFIDNGPRLGTIPKHDGATYLGDGLWKGAPFAPTHWTYFDDAPDTEGKPDE